MTHIFYISIILLIYIGGMLLYNHSESESVQLRKTISQLKGELKTKKFQYQKLVANNLPDHERIKIFQQSVSDGPDIFYYLNHEEELRSISYETAKTLIKIFHLEEKKLEEYNGRIFTKHSRK